MAVTVKLRFTGQLNGLSRELTEERIADLLEKVGMTEAADQKTGTYSRGMRQRLGIADVLMKDLLPPAVPDPADLRPCGAFRKRRADCLRPHR